MPEIGSAVKKNIHNAPPWLKEDSELNYSSDDEIVEKETERSKGKKAVPESRKPFSESSDPKSSSSEDLIIGGDDLPVDGQSGAAWKSNIQSSSGIGKFWNPNDVVNKEAGQNTFSCSQALRHRSRCSAF